MPHPTRSIDPTARTQRPAGGPTPRAGAVLLMLALIGALLAPPARAQASAAPEPAPAPAPAPTATAADDGYIDGVVRRIDAAAGKLTLKHGEIRSLDMPPMTMVFVARDPKQLAAVKVGDAVRFKVEMAGGQMVVTDLQPAR
jgi:Cu/Ag efflux protein CusF